MRRDMDLIRAIMLKLEELPVAPGSAEILMPGDSVMAFEGYSPDQIDYHLNQAAGGFTVDLLKDLAKGFIKKQIEGLTGVKL